MTATQSAAIPTTQGPNYAPAQGLKQYLDSAAKEQKAFPEWIKVKTKSLEQLNADVWTDLSLVWMLLNMMINGDQLAVRGHRSNTWTKVPMPTTTMAPVRQQNKLGFYSRVLMAKWVASRTKLKAIAGDDSDETAGAVRAAQIFADVIQPMVYSEMFRQQEGLAGQAHGTYARYFWYDEFADGGIAYEDITEPRELATDGIGECYDCGYVGSASEFEQQNNGSDQPVYPVDGLNEQSQRSDLQSFGVANSGQRDAINAQFGHDEVGEWEQGLEAPHAPELEQYEQDEQQHLGAIGGSPSNLAQMPDIMPGGVPMSGVPVGGQGALSPVCPSCFSPSVEVEPPQVQTIEAVVGQKPYKLGQMRGISVPYTELRHELSCSAEESPWMRWKRKLRMEEVKERFPGLKIPSSNLGNERDPGLAVEESLRRNVAQSGRNGTGAQIRGDESYTVLTQWWLTPCMYSDYTFPTNIETVGGESIPAGTKAVEMFPDGMYIAIVDGVDAPVQIRNECHKWHWVTAPYRLQMFSGLGIGINDAMEMQRQWNVVLSLIFEQIRSSALPGWLYDQDAISPDDVRLLGQPQNSVPVSTMGRENYTSLQQFVHQMQPGTMPAQLFQYIAQLDSNMQTASGALVNEGVPGMDSKTATGAELMNMAANQHNAPEFALKGDADVRSMKVLFDLAQKHYVEPRYLPLSGKHGKQDGVWLSASDFANGQVRWEAVQDTWLPSTKLDKQQAIQNMFLAVGGPMPFMQLLTAKPDIAMQLMETYGVDADAFDDEYAATAVLCRQRLDYIKQASKQAAPILQQMQQMMAEFPTMMVDPVTGAVTQIDPTEQLAQEIITTMQPPMVPEEPGHQWAITWYRQVLIDDEIKDADPLTRMCVQMAIRKELENMMIEAEIMSQMQMMSQPPVEEGQEGGQSPQKSDKQKRDSQRHAQMGGSQQGQSPQPQAMGA